MVANERYKLIIYATSFKQTNLYPPKYKIETDQVTAKINLPQKFLPVMIVFFDSLEMKKNS